MEKWTAYVTRSFPGDLALKKLKESFEVIQSPGWCEPSRDEYLENMKNADVMLTYSDTLDAELLNNAKKLKFIVDHWGSRNGIDKEAAKKNNIKIYDGMPNSYDWIVKGVAEVAWGMILATGRRFREGDELIRHGNWTHSEQSNHELLGEGLVGRTLGIYGAGRIGTAVARRAAGFEMKVIYTDINENLEMNAMGATRVDKQNLFADSDFIVICLSAMSPKDNYHVVSDAEFKTMKNTAV